jgi:hypothetical protein
VPSNRSSAARSRPRSTGRYSWYLTPPPARAREPARWRRTSAGAFGGGKRGWGRGGGVGPVEALEGVDGGAEEEAVGVDLADRAVDGVPALQLVLAGKAHQVHGAAEARDADVAGEHHVDAVLEAAAVAHVHRGVEVHGLAARVHAGVGPSGADDAHGAMQAVAKHGLEQALHGPARGLKLPSVVIGAVVEHSRTVSEEVVNIKFTRGVTTDGVESFIVAIYSQQARLLQRSSMCFVDDILCSICDHMQSRLILFSLMSTKFPICSQSCSQFDHCSKGRKNKYARFHLSIQQRD